MEGQIGENELLLGEISEFVGGLLVGEVGVIVVLLNLLNVLLIDVEAVLLLHLVLVDFAGLGLPLKEASMVCCVCKRAQRTKQEND